MCVAIGDEQAILSTAERFEAPGLRGVYIGCMSRLIFIVACAVWCGWLMAGCAAPKGTVSFVISADQYEKAIEAARATLRDARLTVDRVDAQAGVVSTFAKPSAGLGTPWDREQATLGDEMSDYVNQHERVASVLFEGDTDDLRQATGTIKVTVDVVVYRVRRSGWRVETESISRSRHAVDPLAISRGQPRTFRQAIRRDDVFAAVLADGLRKRLGIVPLAVRDAAPSSVVSGADDARANRP